MEQLYLSGYIDLCVHEAEMAIADAQAANSMRHVMLLRLTQCVAQVQLGLTGIVSVYEAILSSGRVSSSLFVRSHVLCHLGEALVEDENPERVSQGVQALNEALSILAFKIKEYTAVTLIEFLNLPAFNGNLFLLSPYAKVNYFRSLGLMRLGRAEQAAEGLCVVISLCRACTCIPSWLESVALLALGDCCARLPEGGRAVCAPYTQWLARDPPSSTPLKAALHAIPNHLNLQVELLCQCINTSCLNDYDYAVLRQAYLQIAAILCQYKAHTVVGHLLACASKASAALQVCAPHVQANKRNGFHPTLSSPLFFFFLHLAFIYLFFSFFFLSSLFSLLSSLVLSSFSLIFLSLSLFLYYYFIRPSVCLLLFLFFFYKRGLFL